MQPTLKGSGETESRTAGGGIARQVHGGNEITTEAAATDNCIRQNALGNIIHGARR